MNIEATLIFEVDDRYQHALDIEQAVDKSINETLQSEGVNSHMLTWSARRRKGSAEQQTDNSDYMKCADEVLKTKNYSRNSVHGRKIIEIIKRHFGHCITVVEEK